MATERLEVRLDPEHRRKLQVVAEREGAPLSEMVRRLIVKAYDDAQLALRRQAAIEIGQFQIEDMPSPEVLNRQLEETYEPGGLY